MPDDLYSLLGLKVGCTQDDIKQAYHRMAKLYHPDVNQTVQAAEKMKSINAAYAVLSNVERRMLYDRKIYDDKVRRSTRATSPTFGAMAYPHAQEPAWDPQVAYARETSYSAGYVSRKSNTRMYVICIAIFLLSTLYLLVLPFVNGSTGTPGIITYPATDHQANPTIVVTIQPPTMATHAASVVGYSQPPSTNSTVAPGPSAMPAASKR